MSADIQERLIEADSSIIIAADVAGKDFPELVDQTGDIEGVSAYKIGPMVGYSRLSLPVAVEYIHENTNKKVVFDPQLKGGIDVPHIGVGFAKTMQEAGVNAFILYPYPESTKLYVLEVWIKAFQDKNIPVLIGGEMTDDQTSNTKRPKNTVRYLRMFDKAIELGVRDFVMPGTKPDRIKFYRQYFESLLGIGAFTLYAPGIGEQGGTLAKARQAAGGNIHGIIGRAITEASDVRLATVEFTQQMQSTEV